MTDRHVETQFRRDISSGKVHAVTLVNGKAQSFEEDNLDVAGNFRVIETIDGIERKHLCKRCFPVMFNGENDEASDDEPENSEVVE